MFFLYLDVPYHYALAINDEERRLIELLKRGEKEALKEIFLQFFNGLCRIAFRIVDDEDQAKDIVQDVFLKIWEKRYALSINTSLRGYLKRAVINGAINWVEANKKRLPGKPDAYFLLLSGDDLNDKQEYQELEAATGKAIQELPARTKAVFNLTRFEGMTYREVGLHLGISEKAVEKEMMKALKMLRAALRNYLSLLPLIVVKEFL